MLIKVFPEGKIVDYIEHFIVNKVKKDDAKPLISPHFKSTFLVYPPFQAIFFHTRNFASFERVHPPAGPDFPEERETSF